MAEAQQKKRRQLKEARLEIVAQLYKRGYSIRKIQSEVMKRLGLETYSTGTVHRDTQTLLKEWRESRLEDIDEALQLELTRIDDTVRELWEQWEKSTEDYTMTQRRRKGVPHRNIEGGDGNTGGDGNVRTFSVEEKTQNIVGLGNPTYISEIRAQLTERRKLLDLYAPEKNDMKQTINVYNVTEDTAKKMQDLEDMDV